MSNNFGAEYGRNSGTIVNYVTKSGTNAFHGSGFEFNTGDWSFSKQNGQKNPLLGFCPSGVAAGSPTAFATKCNTAVIPRFVENRFGGTFGGPVVKDKVWFFASYQNDRQRADSSATSSSLTPTPDGITTLAAAFPGNNAVAALQKFGPYGIKVGNPTPAGTIQNITVNNGTSSVSVPFALSLAPSTLPLTIPRSPAGVIGRSAAKIASSCATFTRTVLMRLVRERFPAALLCPSRRMTNSMALTTRAIGLRMWCSKRALAIRKQLSPLPVERPTRIAPLET